MASPSSWSLPDGASVEVTPVSGGFTAQLYGADGTAEGAVFSAVQANLGDYVFQSLTPLATGGYVLSYLHDGALVPGASLLCATFAADGHLLNTAQVSIPSAEGGDFPLGAGQIYALPDGGFVEAWTDAAPYVGGSSGQATVREFDAQGLPVEAAQLLGPLASGQVGVQVNGDGTYVVSWDSYMGPQQRTFTEQGAPLSATHASSAQAFALQSSVTLSGSAGWTGAAVLANHALAIVGTQDGGYGSHVGAEQTYDASGAETASAALRGYAGAGQTLTPEITALGEGYYQVNYDGSTDYEIYNGADQQVFVHNAWSNANSYLTALANGGYVVTDFPDQVMALYDSANHNLGWFGLSGAAPGSILARADGGFDFVFSDHLQGYDAQGRQDMDAALGAAPSSFATAAAALGGDAVGQVWLSPDDGQYGFATSIRFQVQAPNEPGARAIEVAQDLDPWHTAFALQAHADGSAAILWSKGGGVFAAEYDNGAVGPANQALAGDLSTTVAIQLPHDMVGFAWFQNGDAWAEIFDPTTGAAQKADLGAASSTDIASLHALATASGGMAVSWHGASGVLGAVLGASGEGSTAMSLPGDLLGVDSLGHAVILHDQGGTPVLQTYAANDGLFWAA